MSNALEELPNPTTFGTTFNYAAWTPNTQVRLCNVPWNSDYRDVVDYDTQAELDNYLNTVSGPAVTISKMTYARMGDPIRLNLPFNQVMRYNYIRVFNPLEPTEAHYTDGNGNQQVMTDITKTLYYFITGVTYIAPNTTEITVQLDVWQTFRRDVQIGTAFVERGHLGIANVNSFTNYGRDYLTVPEGLDIGNEYAITESYSSEITNTATAKNPWIMVGTTIDFTADPGDVDDPKLVGATGMSVEGLPQGLDIWFFKEIFDFTNLIGGFQHTPWVTQGIQFIIALPNMDDAAAEFTAETINTPLGAVQAYTYSGGASLGTQNVNLKTDWRDTAQDNIPLRYRHLKKFLTFPYTILEMTTYTGQPLMLKPELMNSQDIIATIYRHITPPTSRWTVMPQFYNVPNGGTQQDGEFFDVATHITNFPRLSVLNDQFINYMASYHNRIQYDYASADWSQQRALAGNEAAFNNASTGLGAASAGTDASVAAMEQSTALANQIAQINAVANTGGAAIGGAMRGGPAGMAGSALSAGVNNGVGAAITTYQGNEQLAINRNLARNQQNIAYRSGAAVRDTNKAYADFAANGDYANAIAGINARVQDAKMLPPSISGQMDGESFMMSTGGGLKVYAKVKQPNMAAILSIGDYWLRYGYAINRYFKFNGNSLHCMSKFTYWKMRDVVLENSFIPETFKQTIRGIMEKGVTVWQSAADIGTIDIADNDILPGISY